MAKACLVSLGEASSEFLIILSMTYFKRTMPHSDLPAFMIYLVFTISLFVNVAAIANFDDEDTDLLGLNAANDSKLTHPVTPVIAKFGALKAFA